MGTRTAARRRILASLAVIAIAAVGLPSTSLFALSNTGPGPARLDLRRISVAPTQAAPGETISVAVVVKNTGGTAGNGRILVRQSGHSTGASQVIGRLDAGRSRRIRIPLQVAGPPDPNASIIACRARRSDPRRCTSDRVSAPFSVVTPANLEISPTSHGFGDVAPGSSSSAQTFTVTNTGQQTSGTIGTALGGTGSAHYALSSDGCDGTSLTEGNSCTFDVSFAPTSGGTKEATASASATPGGTASATLSGNGQSPADLDISPTSHGFGTVLTGTSSSAQTFTVTNNGQQTSGTIDTALGGTGSAHYTVSSDGCDGTSLTEGNSCTFDVSFAPTSGGTKAATVSASATPGGTANATLTGDGQTRADLDISPTSNSFGNVLTGTSSSAQTFTVTNNGQQTSGVVDVDLSQTLASFEIVATTCGPPLAGGGTCSVDIRFNPSTNGFTSDDVVASASPGGIGAAALSGTGVATAASLQIAITSSPTSTPTYGSTASRDVGAVFPAGSTVYVWIKNAGEADAYITNDPVPITRSNAKVETFGDAFETCGIAPANLDASTLDFDDVRIAGSSECQIPLRLSALSAAPWSASFTITSSPGGNITGTITGSG